MTKIGKIRIVTASIAILVVISGALGEIWYAGLCSLNVYVLSVIDPVVGPLLNALGAWRVPINLTCPLGYLERSLAVRQLLPQWSFSVALIVVSVILLGRVFCGWVCPAVVVQRASGGKTGLNANRTAAPNGSSWTSYSSYAFLGGVLLASYLFRFPVFCLFCPIGLFFGWLYALTRLFTPEALNLELLLFPVMFGLELWVLRKHWCRSICPLGALLSVVGNLNRFLLPTVRKDRCLTFTKGASCGVCTRVCPEGIDLAKLGRAFSHNSCTKCLECYEKCPEKAIEIALVR